MLAAAALVMAVAPELLAAWLGPRFAGPSSAPLRWLMAGVLMNGIAHIPFAFIQGAGRSDWTAKLHLVEAPLYAVALVVSARRFGLSGVAVVWSLRTTLDLIVLHVLAARLAVIPASVRVRDAAYVLAALVALALVVWPASLAARVGVALAIVTSCAVLGYRRFGERLRAGRFDAVASPGP
jgi:O-antigen/teichoic acid export membrane protein